jgi:cysteine desulfurase
MPKPVYLDYHATTPVDPRVLEAMLPYFTEDFGNPASRQHAYGWHADEAVVRARGEVASLIGATAGEIVFTSGATESNNLAIKGAAHACRERGNHVITVATEHKSVLDSFKKLERDGWRVTRLGVDGDGFIRLDELRAAMTDQTVLVSVMAANNEIGVLQPLAEIGAIVGAAGALLHTDAAQAAGKVAIDVNAMGVDLLSLTGHNDGVRVNGSLERRLPHNLHVSIDRVEGESLLMALGDLAVSTGSACSSGSQAPSHVLQAIGAVGDDTGASIRFGLGRSTTDANIDFAIERVSTVVKSLRRAMAVS